MEIIVFALFLLEVVQEGIRMENEEEKEEGMGGSVDDGPSSKCTTKYDQSRSGSGRLAFNNRTTMSCIKQR
jgi:hypothetical protein